MSLKNIIKDYRLDTIAMLVSLHYRLLKNKVERRKYTGKLELLSNQEAATADYICDVLETVAGKKLANYCRSRFTAGWSTGDLRSYKIKLVLTRLRDIIKPGDAKEELISRFGSLVDTAEFLAGCKADGKRRNKKAREEQEARRAEKAARKAAKKSELVQVELDLPGFSSSDLGDSTESTNSSKVEKIEVKHRKPRKPRRPSNNIYNLVEDIIKKEYDDEGSDEYSDECVPDESQDDTYSRSYGGGEYYRGLGQGFGHYDSTGYNWNTDDDV